MAKSLTVGCLINPPVQFLDIAAVDLFAMMSTSYIKACELPEPLINLGYDVKIVYITPSGADASLTADATIKANTSISSPEVAPGKLDILFIPGPDPSLVPDEPTKAFIRAHAEHKGTDTIIVCTGIFSAGYAGILDGRTVTGPRALTSKLAGLFPKANFVDKKFVRDGDLWCSGGITNGHDIVAAYMRENFPSPLAEAICSMAEVGDRGAEYGQTKVGMFGFFGWQILKAWVTGLTSSGQGSKVKPI